MSLRCDFLLSEARSALTCDADLVVKCHDGLVKTSRVIFSLLLKPELNKELLGDEESYVIIDALSTNDVKFLLQSVLFGRGLIPEQITVKFPFINWELFKSEVRIEPLNAIDKAAPSFECSICGKVLSDKNNLKKHADVVHFNIRKYSCDLCAKRFISRNDLSDHIRTVHNKAKDFICDACGQALSTRHGLRMHKLVHMEGSKSISCARCEKTFRHLSTYRKHISRVHEFHPERRLKCESCGKLYNHNEGLKRHMKKFHPVEKPNFKCGLCSKAFIFNYDLNKHMKRAHGKLL